MKNLFIVSFVLCFLFIFSSSIKAQTEDQEDWAASHSYRSEQFVLKGESAWQNTGIVLKSSDYVIITANGQVLFSASEENSAVSANGMGQLSYKRIWTGDAGHCNDPYGRINHAALIAKVGAKGDVFFVGTSNNFRSKQGMLFIGINDCTCVGSYYNSGEFNVKIGIESENDSNSGGSGKSLSPINTHQSKNKSSER